MTLFLRRRLVAATLALREATFQPPPSQASALAKLRDELPAAPVVVDVGANIGRWTTALLASFPQAHVLMVEAQAEHRERLEKMVEVNPNLKVRSVALADKEGQATFYVCHGDRHRSGSSLMPELTGMPLEERTVMTETLDAVVKAADLPRPVEFLKLDTQGSELQILSGAAATLASVRLVQLEVSLVPYNEGAPVLADIIEFMRNHGFAVRDIFDLMYLPDTDALIQFNCIFTRKPRSVAELL